MIIKTSKCSPSRCLKWSKEDKEGQIQIIIEIVLAGLIINLVKKMINKIIRLMMNRPNQIKVMDHLRIKPIIQMILNLRTKIKPIKNHKRRS